MNKQDRLLTLLASAVFLLIFILLADLSHRYALTNIYITSLDLHHGYESRPIERGHLAEYYLKELSHHAYSGYRALFAVFITYLGVGVLLLSI